jgi:hypothetical protein
MKASRRPLSHAQAVAECAHLSNQYRKMWVRMAGIIVDLNAILQTLRAKKISFVLTGAHGIAGWTGRPRSTQDVDILVRAGRNCVRAVNAIKALYPDLGVRQLAEMTSFFAPEETLSLIDVIYPHRADIQETLETAIWVTDGVHKYRVPALEAALANKYGAILTAKRESGQRAQDAVDFATMVKHSLDEGRQPIDMERLAVLGEKVWPGGGGEELLRLVEDAKEGKVPNLNPQTGSKTE